MRYTTGIPLTLEESAQDLAEIIARYDAQVNEIWVWAVTNRTAEFVGACALFRNEELDFEIAVRLLERCWGDGYGQEIADGLIDYCIGELALSSVTAHAAEGNLASIKILDGSRLKFVGERQNQTTRWTERCYRYVATTGR